MKKLVALSIIIMMVTVIVGVGKSTTKTRYQKDELFYRKINEVIILAILEFDGLKLAIFRDRKTGLMHPLQVGNYFTGGKITRIDLSGARVSREDKPNFRFSVNQRIVKRKTSEHITLIGKDLDLRSVLANLATPASKTVFVDGRLSKKMNISVKDLHWRDLMNILVFTFDLAVEENDNSIRITKNE